MMLADSVGRQHLGTAAAHASRVTLEPPSGIGRCGGGLDPVRDQSNKSFQRRLNLSGS